MNVINDKPRLSFIMLLTTSFTAYNKWPPCVADADIIFLSCGFFFFLLFFISTQQFLKLTCWFGFSLDLGLLWPPCVADADIIFLSCGFFFYLLSIFFSSPNLSRRRLDVCHTSTHGVVLECRSEMCCTRLAGNAEPEKRHLGTCAQLCRGTSLQLRHVSTIAKKPCSAAISPQHVFTIW